MSQNPNLFEFLNLSEELIIHKLKAYNLQYFQNINDTTGRIIHLTGNSNSNDIFRTLNIKIYLNDSISYKLTFTCDLKKIRKIRKDLAIEVSYLTIFPLTISYGNYKYYYIEITRNNLTEVEINNLASYAESSSFQSNKALTSIEKLRYKEILIPDVPSLPKGKKALKYEYGAWIAALLESDDKQVLQYRGELLATRDDSLILLNQGARIMLNIHDIKLIGIYTHDNNPGKYALFTLGAYMPNIIAAIANPEYAGSFFLLGSPVLLVGLINILAEVAKSYPVKYYPEDISSLRELNMFARYPQGLPVELNANYKKY